MTDKLNNITKEQAIMPDKILILGNGFNKWLGLNTSYADYKKFLELPGNVKQFKNCYKLLTYITQNVGDQDWSKLEDDMIDWLNHKNNLNNLPSEINYVKACIEKAVSLKKWVYSIRLENKTKLDKLYDFFKKHSKNISIWTFNYVIDFNNVPQEQLIVNTTPGNPNKRAVTQLHWLSTKDKDREDGTNQRVEIEFGGNYSNFNQKDRTNWTIDQHCAIKFCTKFSTQNLFEIIPSEIFEKYSEAFSDNITNPFNRAYGDASGVQTYAFVNRTIKEANYLGFSFGEQDMPYFKNDNIANLVKYCKTNFTFYKEKEDQTINAKILEIYDCVPPIDRYVNREISKYSMDDLLKHIFGKDFSVLEEIKSM